MTNNKKKSLLCLLITLALMLIVILYVMLKPKNQENYFRQICESVEIGSNQNSVNKLMENFHKEIKNGKDNIIYFKSKKWFDFEACSIFFKDDKVIDTKYILD